MKKIVLVNPPYAKGITRHAPLGICYIASELERNNYDVSFIDMESGNISIDDTAERVISEQPSVVGFACMTPQYPTMLQVARRIKSRKKEAITVFGGPHVSALANEAVSSDGIDFCIKGEGEFAMVRLVQAIERNNQPNIRGVISKQSMFLRVPLTKPILNLDSLPFPARHLLKMSHYIFPFFEQKLPTTNVVGSRGCPYGCTFCYKGLFGNTWRGRSPQNIADEIRFLMREYGVQGIYFMDDNLCANKIWTKALCKKLRELEIVWASGGIRADLIDMDTLGMMKESGCRWIGIGVESGSPTILRKIKKGVTIEQIKTAFKLCHSIGIFTLAFFMIGYPAETSETLMETLAFAKSIDPDSAYVSIYMPYPGTQAFVEATSQGLISDKLSWDKLDYNNPTFTISANFSVEELKGWRDRIYNVINQPRDLLRQGDR
jgi:anaerobic magnesium-protoporphyrin IX monomethyl ester cyclase